jgi:hypothetical protein
MKKSLHLLLVLALTSPLNAQTDFSKVDEQARKIPFPEKQNVAQLASELTAGWATEKEKTRAIFTWLAENIAYDIKTATDEDVEAQTVIEKQKPASVLKSKKAVCEGYANLFNALCQSSGIRSFRVEGLSKNAKGKIGRIGHAWNLVQADGEWGLVDATWGAGSVDDDTKKFQQQFNDKHFFPQPEVFVQSHLPYDPLFQLLPKPIDFQKFKMNAAEQAALPKNENEATAFPNLNDSLAHFVALDSLSRLLNSWSRTLRFDPDNGRANYHLAYFYYNRAIANYNLQQDKMNTMAQNKVRLTQAILKDEEIALAQVQDDLDKSYKLTSKVGTRDKAYSHTTTLRRELESKQKMLAQSQKQNAELKARVKN